MVPSPILYTGYFKRRKQANEEIRMIRGNLAPFQRPQEFYGSFCKPVEGRKVPGSLKRNFPLVGTLNHYLEPYRQVWTMRSSQ